MRTNRQQDLFKSESNAWLSNARTIAKQIAVQKGFVSSDDVRLRFPLSGAIHRNIVGSLFKTKDFKWNGVKKSTTPSRKGGLISVYTLNEIDGGRK